MPTKKIVPRDNDEGGIGTAAKTWGDSWLSNLTLTGLATDATLTSILVETSGLIKKRPLSGLTITVADTEDTTCYVGLWEAATGSLLPKTDEGLTYNALTGSERLTIIGDIYGGEDNNSHFNFVRNPNTGAGNGGSVKVWGANGGTGANTMGGGSIFAAGLGRGTGDSWHHFYNAKQVASGSSQQTYQPNSTCMIGSTGALGITSSLRLNNPTDGDDYFQIDTTAAGATTLTTIDDAAEGAHLTLDIDGDIEINADGGDITFKDAAITLAAINSTGALTSTNYRTIYVDAGSMVPQVTNGAAAGTEELATNDVMMDYFAFDQTTAEFVQFKMVMPEQWDGGAIRAKFYYYTSVTSGDVNWKITANTFDNDDALDTAFGATVGSGGCHEVDDAAMGTAGDLLVSGKTGDFTPAGSPDEGDLVAFRISREPSQEGTAAAADLKLVGVNIQYRESVTASAAW